MLLGLGLLPVAAHAQKKVIIEDEEPNSVMFVSTYKAGDAVSYTHLDVYKRQFAASTHNLSTVHHYLLKIIHRLEISMP